MSTSYGDGPPELGAATHYGGPGLGVPGAEVPTTGHNGRLPLLINEIALPADAAAEFRVFVTSWPPGQLHVYEDSSFTYSGPGGAGAYQGYRDGVPFTGLGSFEFSDGSALGATYIAPNPSVRRRARGMY